MAAMAAMAAMGASRQTTRTSSPSLSDGLAARRVQSAGRSSQSQLAARSSQIAGRSSLQVAGSLQVWPWTGSPWRPFSVILPVSRVVLIGLAWARFHCPVWSAMINRPSTVLAVSRLYYLSSILCELVFIVPSLLLWPAFFQPLSSSQAPTTAAMLCS